MGGARKRRGHTQQEWPWKKSDDLRRAAISIIMEKLISWCIGLRVRLQGVQVVGGQWRAVIGHGWRMARRKGGKGGLGWCEGGGGNCTISLAAVWCCSPCCHTSKREQIKGSSFDEYKTESPAEKHSPSLSNHRAAEAVGCTNPPQPSTKWKESRNKEKGTERTHNHNKGCFIIAINICPLETSAQMREKLEWHQHIFAPHPTLKKIHLLSLQAWYMQLICEQQTVHYSATHWSMFLNVKGFDKINNILQ